MVAHDESFDGSVDVRGVLVKKRLSALLQHRGRSVGCEMQGRKLRASGLRFRVKGLGFRVWGLGFRIKGFGLGVGG